MENPTTPIPDQTKVFEEFNLSGVTEAWRKDIEALARLNKITLGSLQVMAQKQAVIWQNTLEELSSATRRMFCQRCKEPCGSSLELFLSEA